VWCGDLRAVREFVVKEESSYEGLGVLTGLEARTARAKCLRRVEACSYGSLAAMVS